MASHRLSDIRQRHEDALDGSWIDIEIFENGVERAGVVILQRPFGYRYDFAGQLRHIADFGPRRQNEGEDVAAENRKGLPVIRRRHIGANESDVRLSLFDGFRAAFQIAHRHEGEMNARMQLLGNCDDCRNDLVWRSCQKAQW